MVECLDFPASFDFFLSLPVLLLEGARIYPLHLAFFAGVMPSGPQEGLGYFAASADRRRVTW
jgi:hypothetical protein